MAKIRQVNHHIPKWHKLEGVPSIIGLIGGVFVWIFCIILFVLSAYVLWFNTNLVSILKAIKPRHYEIPFLFGALFCVLLFPVSLGVILVGMFIQIIGHKA